MICGSRGIRTPNVYPMGIDLQSIATPPPLPYSQFHTNRFYSLGGNRTHTQGLRYANAVPLLCPLSYKRLLVCLLITILLLITYSTYLLVSRIYACQHLPLLWFFYHHDCVCYTHSFH